MTASRFLYSGFLDAADRFPDRPAVVVDGRTISYIELLNFSKRIAATIQTFMPGWHLVTPGNEKRWSVIPGLTRNPWL